MRTELGADRSPAATRASVPHVGVTEGRGSTVLVCDAHTAMGDALREVLYLVPGVRRAAPAASGPEARQEAERLRPDVAVVTTHLQGGDAIAAARAIRQVAPACQILLLAKTEDAELVLRGVRAGVRGFLTVGSPVTELIHAVESLLRGAVVIPPDLLGSVWDQMVGRWDEEPPDPRLASLSSREREVLRLLAEGGDKRSITKELFISPDTVRSHLQNIFTKLGVRSKLEAVSMVMHHGWMQKLGPARRARMTAH